MSATRFHEEDLLLTQILDSALSLHSATQWMVWVPVCGDRCSWFVKFVMHWSTQTYLWFLQMEHRLLQRTEHIQSAPVCQRGCVENNNNKISTWEKCTWNVSKLKLIAFFVKYVSIIKTIINVLHVDSETHAFFFLQIHRLKVLKKLTKAS